MASPLARVPAAALHVNATQRGAVAAFKDAFSFRPASLGVMDYFRGRVVGRRDVAGRRDVGTSGTPQVGKGLGKAREWAHTGPDTCNKRSDSVFLFSRVVYDVGFWNNEPGFK